MTPTRGRSVAGIVLGVALINFTACDSWGHEGPQHVIDELTAEIDRSGATAELLTRRADELRALNQHGQARQDYQEAISLDSTNTWAHLGLARAYLAESLARDAEVAARDGIKLADDDAEAAPFHALLAEALEQEHRWGEAAHAWRAALQSRHAEVDWHLGLARALRKAGEPLAARDALAAAKQHNPSEVIYRAWIEQLIVCGDFAVAAPAIEERLAQVRWRSAWLLLRAQSALAQGDTASAMADAQAARQELDLRLGGGLGNPVLEAQRGEAQSFLHNISAQLRDGAHASGR